MLQNRALCHCKQRDVGSVWIKDEKCMIEDKWKQFEEPVLNISDSFKDGGSELNNHSAMTVGMFILALSDEFKFCFIS